MPRPGDHHDLFWGADFPDPRFDEPDDTNLPDLDFLDDELLPCSERDKAEIRETFEEAYPNLKHPPAVAPPF